MSDNFLKGKEARERRVKGAKKVIDLVAGTLGPAGYNFTAEHTLPPFQITSNDGVTLALAIELEDKYERIGANDIKEVARKADKSSNDGTTTACVLAGAIIDEGMKSDIHPMKLRRELEACVPIVEKALKKQVKQIDVSEVGKVASISAEDESIGNMIQEIYEKIGKDGIIFNDVSRDFKDTYEIAKGVQITDCGFASPYMADLNEQGQFTTSAILLDPLIVITKQKINSKDDMATAAWLAEGKDLVVFADEVEARVIEDFCLTRIKGGLRTTVIKLPIVYKDWWIEDLSQMTGAKIIDPSLGITLKDITKEMFGTCSDIVVDKEQTFLNGTLDISTHLEKIKAKGDDDSLLRAARLNKKTAKYHVGAPTDTALKYRHDKVVDALGSAYQALKTGVLPGGGVALRNCIPSMSNTTGGEIMKKALYAPIIQIINNGGFKDKDGKKWDGMYAKEVNGVYEVVSSPIGMDAMTGERVDMLEKNIMDAYATVFNSFKSAISVASTILTSHVSVIIPEGKTVKSAFDPYGQQ